MVVLPVPAAPITTQDSPDATKLIAACCASLYRIVCPNLSVPSDVGIVGIDISKVVGDSDVGELDVRGKVPKVIALGLAALAAASFSSNLR